MKILHLTVGHVPFDDRIFYKEATLGAKNFEVMVLAYSRDGLIKTMGGEKRSAGIYNKVEVDVFKGWFRNRYLARLERLFGLEKPAINVLMEKDFVPDVIHCHEPESLKLAIALKKRFAAKIIYDVHEFFFGYSFDKFSGLLCDIHFGLTRRRQKKMMAKVDATVAVNEIVRAFNVVLNPNIPNVTVPNGYILSGEPEVPEKKDNRTILVHEGSLGFNRGIKMMIELFDEPWMRQNCQLKIVGSLAVREREYFDSKLEKDPGLKDCIKITGWVDYEKLNQQLHGDIGLIMMEPKVNNLLAGPPNKLFNYVWAGMPVCSFDIPATSYYIQKFGIGQVVKRNQKALIEGIKVIRKEYAKYRTQIKEVKQEFAFSKDAHILLRLYSNITKAL